MKLLIVIAVVACAAPQALPAPQPFDPNLRWEGGRLVYYGTTPMWCARTDGAKASVCDLRAPVCVDAADRMRRRGMALGDCQPYAAAACFIATPTLTGKADTYCMLSVEFCDETQIGFARDPDWRNVSTCSLYRQRP